MSKRLNDVLGPTSDRRFFKERLMSRMKELNLFPAEVARRARISKDAVSSYMSMRSLPSQKTLDKLAKVLDCKATELLPTSSDVVEDVFVEIREHSRSNYKLFVCRVPLPQMMAMDLAHQVMAFIEKESPAGNGGEVPPPHAPSPRRNASKA